MQHPREKVIEQVERLEVITGSAEGTFTLLEVVNQALLAGISPDTIKRALLLFVETEHKKPMELLADHLDEIEAPGAENGE